MKGKVVLTLTIGFALLLAYLKDKPVLYANSQSYQVYEVVIEGEVGGRQFRRGGTLFVRSGDDRGGRATDSNLVDFWLVSGKPSGTAGKGAIWLATNSAFYGDGEGKVLARVSAEHSALVAHIYPELSAGNENAFSLSADRSENATEISTGQMSFRLQAGGGIDGTIDLTGFNPEAGSFLIYTASIGGQYVGERSW